MLIDFNEMDGVLINNMNGGECEVIANGCK